MNTLMRRDGLYCAFDVPQLHRGGRFFLADRDYHEQKKRFNGGTTGTAN